MDSGQSSRMYSGQSSLMDSGQSSRMYSGQSSLMDSGQSSRMYSGQSSRMYSGQSSLEELYKKYLTRRFHRNVNKKVQIDATVCRHLFTAKSIYMFRPSQHPSSGALKTAVNKCLHTVA